MDLPTYAELVAQRLHPYPYTERIANPGSGVDLLLTCKKAILARYALAVCSWQPNIDGSEFVKSKRREIARTLGALWTLREVGLYLVVCGAHADWECHVSQCPADRTGFHAVIVQAVHFVDPKNKTSSLNQSAWGPVKFGGVDSVADQLATILAD